ncbi:MAG: FG-GAP-like repeat-containing protein [Bacteroidota bacterium]
MKHSHSSISFCLVLLLANLSVALGQISFTEVGLQLGVNHDFDGTNPGGGVSFFDFDKDGWDDLTFATEFGEQIFFYRNVQGTHFQRIWPSPIADISHQMHILWVDYDNDGDMDLYFTAEGPNRLFRNEGALQMVEVTAEAGLPLEDFSSYGAAWADYDRDGWLDLYWVDRGTFNGQDLANRLYRNQGDGTFVETTFTTGARDPFKAPWCVGFLDYNNDLWPDIYVAQDKLKSNTMLRNLQNGTFTDASLFSGTAIQMKAMSVTVGDYDNNGDFDIYVTNTAEGNVLLKNQNGMYMEVASQAGVEFFGNSWGAVFTDVDNDGDQDLYVSGSDIGYDPVSRSAAMYENLGDGTFAIVETGLEGDTVLSHANATGDFNHDGYPDLVESNTFPYPSFLFQNNGGSNHWINIGLQGVWSNRDGIGTRIDLYAGGNTYHRFTQCGIGFQGQNGFGELFGLGSQTNIDSVVLSWPSGLTNTHYDLSIDRAHILIEDTTSLATSIAADSWVKAVDVFPNPVTQTLNWHIQLAQSQAISLRLRDMQGREIWFAPAVLPALESRGTLDMSSLPAGCYLLEIHAVDGQRYYHQVLK